MGMKIEMPPLKVRWGLTYCKLFQWLLLKFCAMWHLSGFLSPSSIAEAPHVSLGRGLGAVTHATSVK